MIRSTADAEIMLFDLIETTVDGSTSLDDHRRVPRVLLRRIAMASTSLRGKLHLWLHVSPEVLRNSFHCFNVLLTRMVAYVKKTAYVKNTAHTAAVLAI